MAHRGVPLEVVHYLAEHDWRPVGDFNHVYTACGLTVTRIMATTLIGQVECPECIRIERHTRQGTRHAVVPSQAGRSQRDIPE
jgi:hypothetical protein